MPSKKKKYNARFPAGRIKKIMQSDEEIGKVAQAVPVIISRTLELFVESLLTKTLKITNSRNAKTLSPSHMKQCIMAENRFDFLRELVKNIPDISVAEEVSNDSSPDATIDQLEAPYDLSMPSTSNSTEVPLQKTIPLNGSSSLIRNNGVTRSCGTTICASSLHSTKLSAGASDESSQGHLKHQWEILGRIHNQTTLSGISSKSLSSEATPPKLVRTDSAPAGVSAPRLLQTIKSSSQQQHHQQQPNQLLPTDLRRFRHQPKSVPGNICTETKSSQKTNSKPQAQTTVIPAPIVSIDLCNKPIVKIDYSNLALHDTSYSESPSSSSSSQNEEQTNKSETCIDLSSLQSATVEPAAIAGSPVINIDLSNIVTSGKIASSSLHTSVISSSYPGISVPPAVPPSLTTNKKSFMELDEDYDDI